MNWLRAGLKAGGLCVLLASQSVQADTCDLSALLGDIEPALTTSQMQQVAKRLQAQGLCDAQGKPAAPVAAPAAPVAQQQPSVWPPEPQDFSVRSYIKGEFTGWRGDTVFQLANGQIWVQRKRAYHRVKLTDPEVEITKNGMGFYMLKLIETGKRVPVKPYEPPKKKRR